MKHKIVSQQKNGVNDKLTQATVRKIRNFMNNWETSGCTFKFDGHRVLLRVEQEQVIPSEKHPFQVFKYNSTKITVRPGTINNLVPTNIFDALTITGSGVGYVVLTLSINGSDSPVSSVLSIETDYPVPSATTPSAPPSTVKDVIAVLNDGVIFQIRDTNLVATSAEVFQETIDNPDPGERDYIPWYRWEVNVS